MDTRIAVFKGGNSGDTTLNWDLIKVIAYGMQNMGTVRFPLARE